MILVQKSKHQWIITNATGFEISTLQQFDTLQAAKEWARAFTSSWKCVTLEIRKLPQELKCQK